ncbi:MAG: Xaa-Pro peptidase family protein [Pseudomonadales bacterium]|jgi:Xaa-Pro dipeptidase|nr:Xaa-Pro peptidase family protein [Pseudomonadales bacterium]
MNGLVRSPMVDIREIATATLSETMQLPLDSDDTDAPLLTMNTHGRLGFSLTEYARRWKQVLTNMAQVGLDVLLVRAPENITYLTGYETPGYYKYHCLVVAPGMDPVLILRRFECLNVAEYSWLTRIVPVDDWQAPPLVTAQVLRDLGLQRSRIGIEKRGWFYTVDEHEQLTAGLPEAELVDCGAVVWDVRLRKSEEELAMIRRSASIVDRAMSAGIEIARPGISDDHINAEVHRVIFESGGEYMSLPPFILSGERTCLPHQTARGTLVGERDLVFMEISATKFRYCAALMRTAFIGQPSRRERRVAEACIRAVETAMATMRPGVTAEAVDIAARAEVERAGFGEYFRHRLGYSVGVNYPPDWGEGEIMSLCRGEQRVLEPGMVFHLVPLCLVYRQFGIGFSETVRITEDGCERFSELPLAIPVRPDRVSVTPGITLTPPDAPIKEIPAP